MGTPRARHGHTASNGLVAAAAVIPAHFAAIAPTIALAKAAADAVMHTAYSDADNALAAAQLALDAAATSPSTAAAAVAASVAVDAAAAAAQAVAAFDAAADTRAPTVAAAVTEAVAAFDAAADTRAPTVIDYVPHRRSGTLSQQDQRELVKRDDATVNSWRRELQARMQSIRQTAQAPTLSNMYISWFVQHTLAKTMKSLDVLPYRYRPPLASIVARVEHHLEGSWMSILEPTHVRGNVCMVVFSPHLFGRQCSEPPRGSFVGRYSRSSVR